ncbi:MAG: 16S rRNA (guanine(527)-N(7))-methyltransferase RsmG [Anaerolineales bacterium]|nr:16S rRNA (guanine(527)-N(7))-methyltransferase RsmG [Anaerolineales bacterium]MCB8992005.1 16S rRNA (guanine(527)-N(7))-methyltransferase RsmG [Ardenticatenaceae bacterium]MCB9004597.1 16S rRNA (guanine(527)-N(7))-methyltransferase RsmG [Ardenticatenaceae bacterium]
MTELTDLFFATVVEWGLALSAEQTAQFARYQALLLEWNQRLNLTAVREPQAIQIRHFLDALSCARVMGEMNGRALIDVGTGAGFPGLPLKILYPDLRLTLVESIAKKAAFLEVVVNELGLTAVTVLPERAEQVGQQPAHREQYDWAVGRAVADLRVLAEYLLPLCRVNGSMLAQKGEAALAEIEVAQTAVATLGGGTPKVHTVQLPRHDRLHYLVVIPKVGLTPSRYPRRTGMPGKRPL